MKVTITYDVGEGPQQRLIKPGAIVGWEKATKNKMSNLSNGMAMEDLVVMLWEQMVRDHDAPGSRTDLLDALVEIDVDVDQKKDRPTEPPAQEASPDT